MFENAGVGRLMTVAAPFSIAVGMALAVSVAQAGRLTDSTGSAVTNSYGDCWSAVGGSDKTMESCGDVAAKPEPKASLEVVAAPTAVTVTGKSMQKVTIAAGMLFAFDSAELSGDARAVIDERIEALRGRAKLTSAMRIEGHTDSTGPEAYNLELSQRRAQAVADYIVSQSYNVTASDIEVVGMGESDPAASNDTAEGRATNRRVVIVAEGEVAE
jgi:outer membrane protein OmpA-like peptidoglycan-associated protein